MCEIAKQAVKEIREACWGYDIPSPCCPEYREHHEAMQAIMKLCDKWLEKLEADTWTLVKAGAPNGRMEIMHEACGRHVICPRCDVPAFCGCGKAMKWEGGGEE